MDSETENSILEMLQTIRNEMTMIVVTHRAAVLKVADIVISMEEDGLEVKGTSITG